METDASDNVAARYILGINYIARIDAAGKLSYYLYNGHGDVVHTVSESGTVENQYDYDVFGNATLTVETRYTNAIRYAGEFFDAETGLYYLRARYYNPYIGRFISEDSYWGEDSNPLSLNRYTYANNNPMRFIDPTGHQAIIDDSDTDMNGSKREIDQNQYDYLKNLADDPNAGGDSVWAQQQLDAGNYFTDTDYDKVNQDVQDASNNSNSSNDNTSDQVQGKGSDAGNNNSYIQVQEDDFGSPGSSFIGPPAPPSLNSSQQNVGTVTTTQSATSNNSTGVHANQFTEVFTYFVNGMIDGFGMRKLMALNPSTAGSVPPEPGPPVHISKTDANMLNTAGELVTLINPFGEGAAAEGVTVRIVSKGAKDIEVNAAKTAPVKGAAGVVEGEGKLAKPVAGNNKGVDSGANGAEKAASEGEAAAEGATESTTKGTGNVSKDFTGKLPSQGTVDAGVPGAPKVDAGKQGKHVPDHPNNVSGKSQWPEGENGVELTQQAWVNGKVVKPDGSVKIWDNGTTKIKVHIDGNGNIHGYPIE